MINQTIKVLRRFNIEGAIINWNASTPGPFSAETGVAMFEGNDMNPAIMLIFH